MVEDFKPKARECKVCLAPHDEETHEATLRVRQWFRDQVTRSFVLESEWDALAS